MALSLPHESYCTGVTGYDAKNKATLVIKNGWIVGEYYNRTAAKTAVYYLVSNGKTFAMMLLGRLVLDYPGLGLGLSVPGDPSTYTKGDPYSSVAFNHLSLVFRNATGLEPSQYLRQAMLDPIGVGRMAYKLTSGMGNYVWATAGKGLASTRDFARLAYLLLHEGNWSGRTIFSSSWIRQFTTVAGYPNISSNTDCRFGSQYPKDLYRIVGSGVNLGFVVPSLDLVATFNGRTPTSMRGEVTRNFLQYLFAAVTQSYVTCDGRTINGSADNPQEVVALTLINADTDQPLVIMTDGMTLTLSSLPTRNLNIRAETSPTVVGSVRFALDGKSNYRTETTAPYALAGDDSGDYRAWTPASGSHTVKGTPYSGSSASGAQGTSLTIRFTVQ
jgi:hypothetical protein